MGKLYQLLYKFFNHTELERRRKDIISTPNKELAKRRGCKESECLWVWHPDCGYSRVATKLMPRHRALYIAKEVDLYL